MFLHGIWPGILKEDGGNIILKQAEKINKCSGGSNKSFTTMAFQFG